MKLAFTASHEIAHLDLDHVLKAMARDLDIRYKQQIKSGAKKIFSEKDNLSEEELKKFKSAVYEKSEFSRNLESEADSMAFVLLMNSGFQKAGIVQLLSKLNTRKSIELRPELFDPLTSSKYPFQIAWLNGEVDSIRQANGMFIMDSIRSHPSLESRKSYLELLMSGSNLTENGTTELPDSIKTILNFEMIESALFVKEADLMLQLSLELLRKYPGNDYLITRIAEVLLDAIEAKKNSDSFFHLPKTSTDFNDHRLLCYNFLKNIRWEEVGEVSFNFLNNNKRFNKENEVHYYLLWKIADLTNREIVKKSILSSYENAFHKGEFTGYMRSDISFKHVARTVLYNN